MFSRQSKLLKTVGWLLIAICLPLSAVTMIDWKTNIRNMPAGFVALASASPSTNSVILWSGTAWVANLGAFLLDPGGNGIIKRTSLGVTGLAVAGTDFMADPGSNGIMKRTSLNNTGIAVVGTDYMGMATKIVFAQSTLTTKGDILCTDGAGLIRLPISTDNLVLTASSAATCGLAWSGGPTGSNSRAHLTTNPTNITTGTETPVSWDTNDYDNGGVHSTITNPTRFTVPANQGGIWRFTCRIMFQAGNGGTYREAFLRQDGTTHLDQDTVTAPVSASIPVSVYVSTDVSIAATHYVECTAQQDTGVNNNIGTNTSANWMSAIRLN